MTSVRERASDEDLLEATRHDPRTFGAFNRRYEQRMLAFLLACTGDAEVAPDLAAEASPRRSRRRGGSGDGVSRQLVIEPEVRETAIDGYVRFVYRLGAENRVASQPCGWYVDDVRIQSGSFTEIGATPAQSFDVLGRTPGLYGYRVVGVYNDGIRTAPSNVETVQVTAGG